MWRKVKYTEGANATWQVAWLYWHYARRIGAIWPAAVPEASIRWGAVIDEWECTDAGQVEGVRGGETVQDRASRQHAWTCATDRMWSPRLNFIANFWAHFYLVLSFSKNCQDPLSAAWKGFMSQGRMVSFEGSNTLLYSRSEQSETIPGIISHTLSAPAG